MVVSDLRSRGTAKSRNFRIFERHLAARQVHEVDRRRFGLEGLEQQHELSRPQRVERLIVTKPHESDAPDGSIHRSIRSCDQPRYDRNLDRRAGRRIPELPQGFRADTLQRDARHTM